MAQQGYGNRGRQGMQSFKTLSLWGRDRCEPGIESADERGCGDDISPLSVADLPVCRSALHAAGKGLDCCVLEAKQIGLGLRTQCRAGSMRGCGCLRRMGRAHFGEERGARLVGGAWRRAPTIVSPLIEHNQIAAN